LILYTPLSMIDIYPEEHTSMSGDRQILSYDGKEIYAEKINASEYRVLQLMSTNPEDFLRNDLQPGARLVLTPFK